MKARIRRYTFLAAIIVLAGGTGYFLGYKRAKCETVRSECSDALMFFTGIHERLEQSNYEEAKEIAVTAANCQILAIETVDRSPLLLYFLSMFPHRGMSDMKAATRRELDRARTHFSQYPNTLTPIAMDYLEATKSD